MFPKKGETKATKPTKTPPQNKIPRPPAGADKGSILVRQGQALSSPEAFGVWVSGCGRRKLGRLAKGQKRRRLGWFMFMFLFRLVYVGFGMFTVYVCLGWLAKWLRKQKGLGRFGVCSMGRMGCCLVFVLCFFLGIC